MLEFLMQVWNVLDDVFSFIVLIVVLGLVFGVPTFILQAIFSTDDTSRKNWPF